MSQTVTAQDEDQGVYMINYKEILHQRQQQEQPKQKQWKCYHIKNHDDNNSNRVKISSNKPERGGE